MTPSFGFAAAAELVPYLRDLGISHLYLSPTLQARPGSTHGYDVVDPSRMSDALGGDSGFRELSEQARAAGLGIILDVVPNHMGAAPENRYWAEEALRERFFDIDPVSGRWRRFFDIDELAGIRIEDREVFEAVSSFILSLVRDGLVDGLRVDHPDGLADPLQYLSRLREGGAMRVWVEKILSATERLPASWPVTGTVGYEFLNLACGLFVDPAAEGVFDSLWSRVSGDERPFGAWALEAKLEQAAGSFAPEVERLIREAEADSFFAPPWAHTTDEGAEKDGIALALASLPVYRTYDPPSAGPFRTRFQQTAPAIMAKGVEDTAFYRYGRLLALNDVGGDPGRFGVTVDEFHAANAARAAEYPEALLTTMTHDAKRSGDVRLRIAALTSIPEEWSAHVEEWLSISASLRSTVDDRLAPDDIERYFIFQTLVGAWPIERDRLDGYLEKAMRESKRNSNWITPSTEWEAAVKEFTAALLADASFTASFTPFVDRVAALAEPLILAQLVLKLTSPGVPDTYQGDELEFRALVDPDNRRPVDFEARQERLAFLQGGGHPGASLDDRKLWVTARLLGLRARAPQPFAAGYQPLDAGEYGCVFTRGDAVLVALELPRAGATEDRLVPGLPAGRWCEVFSGEERRFDGGSSESLSRLVGPAGFSVYERI